MLEDRPETDGGGSSGATVGSRHKRRAAPTEEGTVDEKLAARPASEPLPASSRPRLLPLPGVFLVGAPRCGTTSLYKALLHHPQICAAHPKETHYFVRSTVPATEEESARYYVRRFFPHLSDRHRAMLDGSVSYLYSEEALRRIDGFDPAAKFLVMVRNPADMIHSYYHRLVYLLDEDAPTLAEAWALQAERARGRKIPKGCRDPRVLVYGEVGRLGHYVEQLFATVGRERCHVVVFDDLLARSKDVHAGVLDFIGVERDGGAIRHKNSARAYSSHWLQRFYVNPPKALVRVVDVDAIRTAKWVKRLRKRLKRRNTRRASQPPLDPAMRPILRAHFAEDIEALSGLLGRDLSHWR